MPSSRPLDRGDVSLPALQARLPAGIRPAALTHPRKVPGSPGTLREARVDAGSEDVPAETHVYEVVVQLAERDHGRADAAICTINTPGQDPGRRITGTVPMNCVAQVIA